MRIATTLILRFAVILGLAGLDAPFAAAQTLSLKASVPHITTTGSASADVVPDEAVIALGVMAERPTAEVASNAMAAAAAAVVAESKGNGVDPKDIKTISVNLTMVYDDERDASGRVTKHTFRAYQAAETLQIRVRDVTKAGGLAQALIAKGANQFQSIQFDYSKEWEKRRELQADAMRDALAEARSYTGAIGLKLGRVIQIGDDPAGAVGEADLPTRRAPTFGKTMATVAIPVEPGVETLSASINVTWEIENER